MIDTLTIGEAAEVETLSGIALDELEAPGKPKMRLVMALYFILKRRDNPELSFVDVGSVPLSDISKYLDSVQTDADPKE